MYDKLKKSLKELFLPTALIFLSGLAIYLTTPGTSGITVRLPDGKTVHPAGLYNEFPSMKGAYVLKANLHFMPYSQHIFAILPDDCLYRLELNGRAVRLPRVPVCYADKTITVDLSRSLHTGTNTLEAVVHNNSGPYGLYIRSSLADPTVAVAALIGLASFAYIIWGLLRRLAFARSTTVLILGSLILRFWYLSYTVFTTREHDVWPHIDYMDFISRMFALPNADACYECHQQPLYYIFNSLVVGIARLLKYPDVYTILQIGNILTFLVLIIIIALLVRRIWEDEFLQNLALALFAFWPSGIIDSARIGNDVPFYTGYGLSLYFLYRYLHEEGTGAYRHLLYALIAAGITVFVKINAIALLPLIVGVYLYKHHKHGFNRNLFLFLVIYSLFIVGLSFIPYFLQTNNRSFFSRITKSDQIGKVLKTGNKLANYTFFDQAVFLQVPFTSPVDDAGGRQYVWNYFLKSSLFGEYHFNDPLLKQAGTSLSYLALAIFIYMFSGILYASRRDMKQLVLFVLNMAILMVIFLYYRSHFPSANNTDFRYVFPIVISFIYFFIFSLKRFKDVGLWPLAFLGCVLGLAFVILTQYFFIIIPLTG